MAKANKEFNNSSVILRNQELEEAEELEERKRREEEVHSLLSHAMGQFNFDEQSTINSSMTSNEADNSIIHVSTSLSERYREGNLNDQLKTLYDVRVREVETLNKEIDTLKKNFNDQQNQFKKRVTLLEAENQRKSISLTESQSLLVEKTEQHMQLNEELKVLKNNVLSLETTMKELQEENEVLRQLNMDLEKQIIISQKGFPLLGTTIDKEFQESQRIRIQQLEIALQQAQEETKLSNQQQKKIQEELKRNICERENDVLEKNMFINALSNENRLLQEQFLECSKTIDEQKIKLESSGRKGQHLEEELRKFKEKREMIDELRETIWKEATTEFQPQLASLHLQNQKLKEELDASKKEIKRDFDKTRSLEVQNKDLEDKLDQLQSRYDELSSDMGTALSKLHQCIDENKLLQDQQSQLFADNQLLASLKVENEKLQKKIVGLEVNVSLDHRAVQTSLPFVNNTEFARVQDQLVTAHDKVNKLENEIKLLQGRETLIKELQQKAAMFEKIIQQKQKNRSNEMVSIGVNTTSESDSSMLKVQYDTLLYQTKAKLHKKLKKDFDDKLTKALTEYNCKECKYLKEEVFKLTEMRQQDRDAVIKLVSVWENKFDQFEKDVEREYLQLLNEKTESENTVVRMKKLLELYIEKYKTIEEYFEKYNEDQFESHKEKLVMQTRENYVVILKHLNRIKGKILYCSKEMRVAETKFQGFDKL